MSSGVSISKALSLKGMLCLSKLNFLEEELKATKKINWEFQSIIENFYDAIVVSDGEGRVVLVNKAYERITGLKIGDLLYKDIRTIVDEGILSESSTLKVLKTRQTETVVQKIKTGKTMLVTGVPVFDENGGVYLVVSSCRDLTDLKDLEQKLKETERLTDKYYKEVTKLRAQQLELDDIISESPKMKRVIETAVKVAEVDSNVVILGESGVGKGIVAKLIHKFSNRAKKPFIRVSCGSIPENLLETEFFGYEEGAFTGASKKGKIGTFELANEGSLFLDEVGELPLNLQVKLLTSTQEKTITRVGGINEISIDIRFIAATNRDLLDLIQEKKFRSDLYYRLSVVTIHIPPLRERLEDIFPLAMNFLDKYNNKYNYNKRITPEVLEMFHNYYWPGNVRELENAIERLVVLGPSGTITTESLEGKFVNTPGASLNYLFKKPADVVANVSEEMCLPQGNFLRNHEKQLIITLYKKYKSARKVASIIGVNQSTVSRKLKKYKAEL
jgi:PAS domain S-box-containing protein